MAEQNPQPYLYDDAGATIVVLAYLVPNELQIGGAGYHVICPGDGSTWISQREFEEKARPMNDFEIGLVLRCRARQEETLRRAFSSEVG